MRAEVDLIDSIDEIQVECSVKIRTPLLRSREEFRQIHKVTKMKDSIIIGKSNEDILNIEVARTIGHLFIRISQDMEKFYYNQRRPE